MRRSCLIHLALLIILATTVASAIRRYVLPAIGPASAATPVPPSAPESLVSTKATRAREPLAIAAAPTATTVPPSIAGIEGLTLELVRPLMIELPPIQGLAIHGAYLYVGAHDPELRGALLYQLHRDTQTLAQMRVVAYGDLYVVGGLHGGQELIWVALRDSKAERGAVLGVAPQSLNVIRRFEVRGPLTAIAEGSDGHLYGSDPDGLWLCRWTDKGQELGCVSLANGARYSDMDVVNGSLVCAGSDSEGGVLDVYDPQSLSLLVRHRADARSRDGTWVSGGGFAYADGLFHFLPAGGRYPMLLTYRLAGGTLANYVPSVP